MDTEGNFLMVNPAGIELFGLVDHELASNNFQDLYVDGVVSNQK